MDSHIELDINDSKVSIGYFVESETKIPENKKEIHITVTDCPKEILDCYGEDYIEQMIREEVENERE